MVIQINSESEFSKHLSADKDKLVVVDFTAKWCGPCKVIAPVFESLSKKYPAVKFLKVDVDDNPQVSAKNGISAMPTFQFFLNGARVAELKGANANGLEELIKKHSNASTAANNAQEPTCLFGITGQSNLVSQVVKQQISCLNSQTGYDLAKLVDTSSKEFLKSDCDEQLMISFQFLQHVKLHSIKFNAPADSGPKTVKLYVNRPNLGFDDAETMEATQVISLTPDDFSPSKATNLRFVKFQNLHSLTVFVEDNQTGADVTCISSLVFIGSIIDSTADLTELKKEQQ